MAYNRYLPYCCNASTYGQVTMKYGVNGHTGVDSITSAGKVWDVCAVCDATVQKVYWSDTLGNVVQYGYTSTIGEVVFAYYHLGSVNCSVGQKVYLGTKIGVMGNTGSMSKGVHLHVSMWINGSLVDPEPYLGCTKSLPTKKGAKYMIRKVTKVLNLRSTRSLANNNNIVYSNMPVGTIFLVTDTVVEGGVTWGKIFTVINGKTYGDGVIDIWCSCRIYPGNSIDVVLML